MDNPDTGQATLIVVGAIYFTPTIIAFMRGHLSKGAILALNLLLGWTGIAWLVALLWSLTGDTRLNQQIASGTVKPTGFVRSAQFIGRSLRTATAPRPTAPPLSGYGPYRRSNDQDARRSPPPPSSGPTFRSR